MGKIGSHLSAVLVDYLDYLGYLVNLTWTRITKPTTHHPLEGTEVDHALPRKTRAVTGQDPFRLSLSSGWSLSRSASIGTSLLILHALA
jgi:hypothetical protein